LWVNRKQLADRDGVSDDAPLAGQLITASEHSKKLKLESAVGSMTAAVK
jgi:hypothetical protein